MTSTRETAIAALFDVLQTAILDLEPAPTVLRNETVPQRLPPGGVLVLQDGETEEATPYRPGTAQGLRSGTLSSRTICSTPVPAAVRQHHRQRGAGSGAAARPTGR